MTRSLIGQRMRGGERRRADRYGQSVTQHDFTGHWAGHTSPSVPLTVSLLKNSLEGITPLAWLLSA